MTLKAAISKNGENIFRGATPKGVSYFAQVVEPSTRFNKNGVYQMTLIMHKQENGVNELIQQIDAVKNSAYNMAVKLNDQQRMYWQKKPLPPLKDENHGVWVDEDGKATDYYFIRAKATASGVTKQGKSWEFAPKIFDAYGTPITDKEFSVGNGSVCKMAVQLIPYATVVGYGVSIRLEAVQVINHVPINDKTAESYGFEVEATDTEADAEEREAPVSYGDEDAENEQD